VQALAVRFLAPASCRGPVNVQENQTHVEILPGFLVFADAALFVLMCSGGDNDTTGETLVVHCGDSP
jgi:hypothetical protein